MFIVVYFEERNVASESGTGVGDRGGEAVAVGFFVLFRRRKSTIVPNMVLRLFSSIGSTGFPCVKMILKRAKYARLMKKTTIATRQRAQ
jgi:hypothetical protein